MLYILFVLSAYAFIGTFIAVVTFKALENKSTWTEDDAGLFALFTGLLWPLAIQIWFAVWCANTAIKNFSSK